MIDDVENNRVAGLDRRRARGADDHPPPAGREHPRDHRAASRRCCPQLTQSISPAIDVEVALDRTQTIRASVRDVERTLAAQRAAGDPGGVRLPAQRARHRDPQRRRAAVAGRHVRRDVPARLQPRQPVADGADHLDRLRGRRRHRGHREHRALHRGRRCRRCEAALEGARQIGFTIVSITVSLLAVFIPILLMGGIVGRLFREFAVTLSVAIAHVGGGLADADADDVRAPAAPAHERAARAALRAARSAPSTALVARLRPRRSRWVLAPRAARCCCSPSRTRRRSPSASASIVPKGLFPQQDTGLLTGFSEAPQDISFAGDAARAGAGQRDRRRRPRRRRT